MAHHLCFRPSLALPPGSEGHNRSVCHPALHDSGQTRIAILPHGRKSGVNHILLITATKRERREHLLR
ncbi:MAG TPA: hypothetical protein VFV38_26975, partial [Ktedonobacteraceae bacterium]|nr:hypothetical protein [Ktedonobacteraceae bacterium]